MASTNDSFVRRAYDIGRGSWPALGVSFEEFRAHLAALGYEHTLPCQLGSLYLCIACSLGREGAWQLVERRYFSNLRNFLSRFDSRQDVVDELLQQVRCRLLVGPKPTIRSYRGEGPLDAWLRKIAGNIALDFLRSRAAHQRQLTLVGREPSCREATHGQPPRPPDEHLHGERSRRRLEAALRRALDTLPIQQRQVLRHYFVSQLTIDQLGVIYRCDRSTAARRIAAGVHAIRRRLREELPRKPASGIDWDVSGLACWWRLEIDDLFKDGSREQ